MYFKLFGIVILLQIFAIGSDTTLGIDINQPTVVTVTGSVQITKAFVPNACDCNISSKYVDIAQVDRSHIQDASVDQIVTQLKDTLGGNYKTIYDIMAKTECNFSYVQRGLKNIQQRVLDIIEIFTCPEQRKDKDRLDAAVNVFVSAKDSMIADMRSASECLSQECADLFTKIRPAACNTGENIIFAVLNSLDKQ